MIKVKSPYGLTAFDVQYAGMGTDIFLALYGLHTAAFLADPTIRGILTTNPSLGQQVIHDSLLLEQAAKSKEDDIKKAFPNHLNSTVICP